MRSARKASTRTCNFHAKAWERGIGSKVPIFIPILSFFRERELYFIDHVAHEEAASNRKQEHLKFEEAKGKQVEYDLLNASVRKAKIDKLAAEHQQALAAYYEKVSHTLLRKSEQDQRLRERAVKQSDDRFQHMKVEREKSLQRVIYYKSQLLILSLQQRDYIHSYEQMKQRVLALKKDSAA
ncbi:hypothetical protein Ciccas_004519 [Cichlidogyrus casuarinus]|uniref:Uncharacterized protein n=1 Tax=Cichlidogyrus casuarinus TaxID=1844966 RepID=A0ABD2QC43_9PLAT